MAIVFWISMFRAGLLLVKKLEMLYIDCLHLRRPFLYRRLLEVLAGAEFADSAGLPELSLEFLESALDVLAFLDWNYDHFKIPPPFS